jgi:hypothetical protein
LADKDDEGLQQDLPQEGVAEGGWVEFDDGDMQKLLAAWASGHNVVHYSANGCDYEVDFTSMLQTNLTTGDQQRIGVEMVDDTLDMAGEWLEYVDPESGKPYYSNGVSTTWERPHGAGVHITSAADYAVPSAEHEVYVAHEAGVQNVANPAPSPENVSTTAQTTKHNDAEKATTGLPRQRSVDHSSSDTKERNHNTHNVRHSGQHNAPAAPPSRHKKYSLAREPPPKSAHPQQQKFIQPPAAPPYNPRTHPRNLFTTPEAPPYNPHAAGTYDASADWQPPWQAAAPRRSFKTHQEGGPDIQNQRQQQQDEGASNPGYPTSRRPRVHAFKTTPAGPSRRDKKNGLWDLRKKRPRSLRSDASHASHDKQKCLEHRDHLSSLRRDHHRKKQMLSQSSSPNCQSVQNGRATPRLKEWQLLCLRTCWHLKTSH